MIYKENLHNNHKLFIFSSFLFIISSLLLLLSLEGMINAIGDLIFLFNYLFLVLSLFYFLIKLNFYDEKNLKNSVIELEQNFNKIYKEKEIKNKILKKSKENEESIVSNFHQQYLHLINKINLNIVNFTLDNGLLKEQIYLSEELDHLIGKDKIINHYFLMAKKTKEDMISLLSEIKDLNIEQANQLIFNWPNKIFILKDGENINLNIEYQILNYQGKIYGLTLLFYFGSDRDNNKISQKDNDLMNQLSYLTNKTYLQKVLILEKIQQLLMIINKIEHYHYNDNDLFLFKEYINFLNEPKMNHFSVKNLNNNKKIQQIDFSELKDYLMSLIVLINKIYKKNKNKNILLMTNIWKEAIPNHLANDLEIITSKKDNDLLIEDKDFIFLTTIGYYFINNSLVFAFENMSSLNVKQCFLKITEKNKNNLKIEFFDSGHGFDIDKLKEKAINYIKKEKTNNIIDIDSFSLSELIYFIINFDLSHRNPSLSFSENGIGLFNIFEIAKQYDWNIEIKPLHSDNFILENNKYIKFKFILTKNNN